MNTIWHSLRAVVLTAAIGLCSMEPAPAGQNVFGVQRDQLTWNGEPFKVIGLRCSNALMTDRTVDELIEQLPVYRAHGVNTVSVYFMGSRFGDIKGYRPDASLDPAYAGRMERIIRAADRLDMAVLVGCLYWGTSRAKEGLVEKWNQADANLAVANTTEWLGRHEFRNVFVDPDNEGMAHDAMGWDIGAMIDAGHAANSAAVIAYNDHAAPPENADLYIHHSPKVAGKPWLDSEATPGSAPGGYWGTFSKQTHRETNGRYYNYSRIGRYTEAMKAEQFRRTANEVEQFNGHMLASTWLQCAPHEGVEGPFARPGGFSRIDHVDADIDRLHPDAGIAWWLVFVKENYGPWDPR